MNPRFRIQLLNGSETIFSIEVPIGELHKRDLPYGREFITEDGRKICGWEFKSNVKEVNDGIKNSIV